MGVRNSPKITLTEDDIDGAIEEMTVERERSEIKRTKEKFGRNVGTVYTPHITTQGRFVSFF